MPLYEYDCPDCGHRKEVYVKPQGQEIKHWCDLCQVGMKKVISACDFHLKGRGWADNGYSKGK